jgi:hypothetical protein
MPNRLALSWLAPSVDVGYSGYRDMAVTVEAPRVRVLGSPPQFARLFGTSGPSTLDQSTPYYVASAYVVQPYVVLP